MDFKYLEEITDFIFPFFKKIYDELLPIKHTGRKRIDAKKILLTVLFVLRTGCQWRMVPPCEKFAKGTTAHHNFQLWVEKGIIDKLYSSNSVFYEFCNGFQTSWQSVDCTKVQAPVRALKIGHEDTGANPTDRGFKGSKISLLVDKIGMPMSFVISGANVHDSILLEETLQEGSLLSLFRIDREHSVMHLCLDKGYDGQSSEVAGFMYGYKTHIRTRREEITEKQEGKRPKRWVCERTHVWVKAYRHIRTRYTKYSSNFRGLVALALSVILARRIKLENSAKDLFQKFEAINWETYFNWQEQQRQRRYCF